MILLQFVETIYFGKMKNTKLLVLFGLALSTLPNQARADYDRCDQSTYPNHIVHCVFKGCNVGTVCTDTGQTCEWKWTPAPTPSTAPEISTSDIPAIEKNMGDLSLQESEAFCH